MESKVFCKGLLCHKSSRKQKCLICGKMLCNMCVITSERKNRNLNYCPNCYFLPSINWDKMNKEFEEMLKYNKNEHKITEKEKQIL